MHLRVQCARKRETKLWVQARLPHGLRDEATTTTVYGAWGAAGAATNAREGRTQHTQCTFVHLYICLFWWQSKAGKGGNILFQVHFQNVHMSLFVRLNVSDLWGFGCKMHEDGGKWATLGFSTGGVTWWCQSPGGGRLT